MSSISWVAIDLTLTTSVAPCVAGDRGDDRVRLGRVARPVDRAAGRGHGRLELLEEGRQVAHDLVLDRGAGQPKRLPVGTLGDGRGPLRADRRGRPSEVRAKLVVRQRRPRRLGERRRARNDGSGRSARPVAGVGADPPARSLASPVEARISARCMTRTGDRRRDSSPPMCIRHDVSPAVRTSAPEPSTSSTLSRPIATDVSAFLTAKVPPNPQHASDRGRSTRVRPSTAASSRRRPIADPEQAHRMARRMERDRVREARPDVGHAEDVDEELAQLEDARSHRGDLRRQVGPGVARPRPAGRRPDGGRGPSPRTSRTA